MGIIQTISDKIGLSWLIGLFSKGSVVIDVYTDIGALRDTFPGWTNVFDDDNFWLPSACETIQKATTITDTDLDDIIVSATVRVIRSKPFRDAADMLAEKIAGNIQIDETDVVNLLAVVESNEETGSPTVLIGIISLILNIVTFLRSIKKDEDGIVDPEPIKKGLFKRLRVRLSENAGEFETASEAASLCSSCGGEL